MDDVELTSLEQELHHVEQRMRATGETRKQLIAQLRLLNKQMQDLEHMRLNLESARYYRNCYDSAERSLMNLREDSLREDSVLLPTQGPLLN